MHRLSDPNKLLSRVDTTFKFTNFAKFIIVSFTKLPPILNIVYLFARLREAQRAPSIGLGVTRIDRTIDIVRGHWRVLLPQVLEELGVRELQAAGAGAGAAEAPAAAGAAPCGCVLGAAGVSPDSGIEFDRWSAARDTPQWQFFTPPHARRQPPAWARPTL